MDANNLRKIREKIEPFPFLPPCGNSNLEKLCSEYSDILLSCNAITPRDKQFRDRGAVLRGKGDCADLFELKNELLKTKYFKSKVVSWCMFPVLKKGDVLKIKPAGIDNISIGDIPVYRSQGKLYAHRAVDKQVINGRQFIITRPDTSCVPADNKSGEKVSEENILGRIEEIERRGKTFSTQRNKAAIWDKFLYKKLTAFLKSTALLRKILEVVLVKIQSFRVYELFGKKAAICMASHFNFELAVPFSNQRLNRLYNYIPLKDDKKVDFFGLKETKIFHLIMKFNKTPIGCASILNRPVSCPYKDFCIGDVYTRLRYKGLGFDSILLRKAEDIVNLRI